MVFSQLNLHRGYIHVNPDRSGNYVFIFSLLKKKKIAVWRLYKVALIFNEAIELDSRHINCGTASSTVLFVLSRVGRTTENTSWFLEYLRFLRSKKGVFKFFPFGRAFSKKLWTETACQCGEKAKTQRKRGAFKLIWINVDVNTKAWNAKGLKHN